MDPSDDDQRPAESGTPQPHTLPLSDPQPTSIPPAPTEPQPAGSPTLPPPAATQPSGYPAPAAYPGPAQAQPPLDGFSVAALVFGIFGGLVLGLLFGIIGVVRTKGGQRRGRGFAVAGIALSVLWLLAIIAVIAVALTTQADRDATGQVVAPGTDSFADVRVGDCLVDITESVAIDVSVVPCDQPHEGEVFAIWDMTGTTFPGEQAVTTEAEAGCRDRVPAELTESEFASDLTLFMYYPREQSWAGGDRQVICVAMREGTGLTGGLPG